jgi:putative endonuclease
MAAKDELGAHGEELAARELLSLGWSVLARNWRPGPGSGGFRGEIDIVAQDGDEIVVVEVKTRRSGTFGGAVQAVSRAKVARLRRLAAAWLAAHERRFAGVRIDVVCIDVGRDGTTHLEILKGVE